MDEKKDILENTENSVEYNVDKEKTTSTGAVFTEAINGKAEENEGEKEESSDFENPAAKSSEETPAEQKKELTPEELEAQQEEEKARQIQELEARKEKRKLRKKRRRIASAVAAVCVVLGAAGAGGYYLYDSMVQYKEQVETLEAELAAFRGETVETDKTAAKETEGEKETKEAVSENVVDETSEKEEKAAKDETSKEEKKASEKEEKKEKSEKEKSAEEETKKAEVSEEEAATVKKYLKKAAKYAQQYDYDKAVKTLKKCEYYESNEDLQNAAKEYKEIKASCVSWPIEEITHVFYHTLIKDPSKSFDGDYKEGDYNQVMTTIDEFNKITQEMYDRGYVMVSLYDMATVGEDGTMERQEILLPEGKIPFVLSQDDVSYYHYMDGDGYATKLVLDEEGKVRNEYIEDDGSVSIGDYDMVPLIDRFVEEHPDFSYKGAKGIVALTGYNGVLGYRTDISYETRPDDLDEVKVKWLEANPDFDLEKEREEAIKVATAMRENGWMFASHTWGHLNVQEASLERLKNDTKKFKENVDPVIGGTDIIIFAFGTDLSELEDYSGEKFEYYKKQGYNYFCNVDSSKYFVQLRDNYLRMGRRNLDGYRMYYHPELLEDLFVAGEVFDESRPTPVPEM